MFCVIYRYPYTATPVNKYELLAQTYNAAFKIPQICPERTSGTDAITTDFLFKEYYTPMLTLKVSCCDYPAVENLPYIWRDILAPLMSILNATRTGMFSFQIVDLCGYLEIKSQGYKAQLETIKTSHY